MAKYYVQLVNDELPAPLYVKYGKGFSGVELTGSLKEARRYDTEAEAEKIAALARAQKDKERGGEMTTVQIVTEDAGSSDGWETRFRFTQDSTGVETVFQMKKSPDGIRSRYITFGGSVSDEFPPGSMKDGYNKWLSAVGAWGCAKIDGR